MDQIPTTRRCSAPSAIGPRGGATRGLLWTVLALVVVVGLALVVYGPDPAPRVPKVLLVGIDGADWRMIRPLMAQGELPNLTQLILEGTHGPFWSLHPIISPVIWTTIATGKGPDQHGVLDFTMPDPETGAPIVVSSNVRRSKAFWNILSERGLSVVVVGWWASWPAEPVNGAMVSDRLLNHPFLPDAQTEEGLVYPPELTGAVTALRGNAADLPYETARRFIDVTPEAYAAAPALDYRDPISHFRHIYQNMRDACDVAKSLQRREQPDLLAVYFEGIDTAGHMYMRYAPPEYPHTTPEDRRRFGDTVNAFYRYQDELLGELLALTDASTTVMIVSDHGFKTGRARPVEESSEVDYQTAPRWHRMEGVLLMKGPQVGRRESEDDPAAVVEDVSVFDVTPTLLAVLGLPVAQDMDGRVATELFTPDLTVPDPIPTYEGEAWAENRAAARTSLQGLDEETKAKLQSLGYIGADATDEQLSLRAHEGLTEYYIYRGELDKAEQALQELIDRAPEKVEPHYHLGLVYMRGEKMLAAKRMYAETLELDPEHLEARMNLAYILRQRNERREAIAVLEEGLTTHRYHAGVRVNLGMLHKELGELDTAAAYFDEALRLNPRYHPAHVQAAMVREKEGDLEGALEHWRAAAQLRPSDRTARSHIQRIEARLADGGAEEG